MRQSHDVGDRVETTDGDRGIVRWVGAVANKDGVWLGVEWDDPLRGKHDGAHDGVRYFACKNARAGAHGASFVRPHKVRASRTFVEAFWDKYSRSPRNEREEDDMYIHTVRGHRVRVELCETTADAMDCGDGGVKRRLREMKRAYVDDARVATVGPPGEAGECAGALEVLGLAGSLLSSWNEVLRLAEEFPRLEALDLTGMRPTSWSWDETNSTKRGGFERLKVLVLNDTNITWQEMCSLSVYLPELRELYLNLNGIETFRRKGKDSPFPKLHTLSLDGNAVKDWSEVEELGRSLPNLQKLHLSQNALREIERSTSSVFPTLKSLLVGDNALSDWRSVDALDAFPELVEARLSGNPLAESASARHEIIARVARLAVLNGSMVTVAERKDSEIRYLRRVLQQLKDVALDTSARNVVSDTNPRVDALVNTHGDLVTHATRAPGVATLASASIELNLRLESSQHSMRKKLPRSTTIGKLKLLCAKLFKISVADTTLVLIPHAADSAEPTRLSPDEEPLARFDPSDGDIVAIHTSA